MYCDAALARMMLSVSSTVDSSPDDCQAFDIPMHAMADSIRYSFIFAATTMALCAFFEGGQTLHAHQATRLSAFSHCGPRKLDVLGTSTSSSQLDAQVVLPSLPPNTTKVAGRGKRQFFSRLFPGPMSGMAWQVPVAVFAFQAEGRC